MVSLNNITTFLDKYLELKEIDDSSWNGLQIEGKNEIKKIAFAVDACVESFEKAVAQKADLVIVHHGLFWKGTNPSLSNYVKNRVNILLKENISLYCAHLPLDRHSGIGNNTELLRILGATIKEGAFPEGSKNVGWIGELKKSLSLTEIEHKLNNELSTKCIVVPAGNPEIKRIGICSGGGNYADFNDSIGKADLYITGDTTDLYQLAKDARMNVIFTGHYASETVGLKALSTILKKKFSLETVFIDAPTGL